MTGATFRRGALRAFGALLLALLFAAPPADARTQRTFGNRRVISPDDVNSATDLSNIFFDLTTTTFVFKKGTYDLGAGEAFVFFRNGITICGQTGRAGDVVFQSSAAQALVIDHSSDVLIRDLTIRNDAGGEALRLSGFRGGSESRSSDVTVQGCTLEGRVGANATVRVDGFTVDKCTIRVNQTGGVGIGWQDGEGLFVHRTTFRTADGVEAAAGVRVLGPLSGLSNGERARTIVLSNNEVRGDYTYGFDLLDVVDVRIRRNKIRFPSATQGVGATGRVGIWIRRLTAAALPTDVELFRNNVRKAVFGARMDFVDAGVVRRNDFRRCGTPDSNNSLGVPGGAVLVSLTSSDCIIERNDFRNLRTPNTVPAVVEASGQDLSPCFPFDDRNKNDRGRPLYTGEQP